MPVKEFIRKLKPVQLYVVLALTVLFFAIELVFSHLTHALTLLMDSYHMLCNILALAGCITTIKYESQNPEPEPKEAITLKTECQDQKNKKVHQAESKREKRLRNTFGWTRIDVITTLICCVFLASFSFSIYVEAFQTLVHIDHQDAMHQPISALCVGVAGLLLNGLCYLLIGGYTYHQGSFLYVTESGDVVLSKVVVIDSATKGGRKLSRIGQALSTPPKKRQGLWEISRDICCCALVIVCSIVVMFVDSYTAKYIDPAMSLLSATCIMFLSYPYIKESCMILLQTIPVTTDIEAMEKELVKHFPDIINVHDFHIWQLTASKVISTVHIIFENPKVYRNIMKEIREFFLENGVTQVTIQPEFFHPSASMESLSSANLPPTCLVACQGEECKLHHCCPNYKELSKFKSPSKETISKLEPGTPTLKSVQKLDVELMPGSCSSLSKSDADGSSRTTPQEGGSAV
ncbi:zinc homeostasis factor 1 isoform X2 [Dendroctonus ponderosae]|uniref:Cation efflux protein cytoplasmic domain-containing protein n=2 Tax=Dendroctonus ponderosae TaxID=77166 RepID=U4UPH8_DENPD|nr:zinc homeostasis factor 1 isoform X2 [Dendroctonus ponderosae]XP_048526729.1 zinc homeostasis factor 1 isoform X2 [Dendroctonus ponderosae]ERL91925.1 hypothetical protein D910_09248 [Dendroctonus ponderosae]KAH1026942.1 hypothetical protein HUJ05_000531 [Dendroctonus ponderosae]